MLFFTIFILAGLMVTTPVDGAVAAQSGQARIINRCDFDLNYWNNNQGPQIIAARSNWSENFNSNGHRTITIMDSPRLWSADPKVMFGYTFRPDLDTVWYDLYSGDGHTPFEGKVVVQHSGDLTCRFNYWPNGLPVPGDHIFQCRSDRDVTLTLCA